MSLPREDLLAVVERSPSRVAAHDREGWLAIFSDDAVVEDPVGSAPAPKRDGTLARFYDTFIAPHDIRFEIRRDHVIGNDVFRDAMIHTKVRAGVEVQVPAYLLYQVDEAGGTTSVRRMAAHWTLARMTLVAMTMGPRAWIAMTGLFARMVRIMGVAWVAAYLASLWRGIGSRGGDAARSLAKILEARDASRVGEVFTSGDAEVEWGEQRLTASMWLDAVPPATHVHLEGVVSAGWTTSFRFRVDGDARAEGLCLLEFARASRRIAKARFFLA
jgi:hypothetical protein